MGTLQEPPHPPKRTSHGQDTLRSVCLLRFTQDDFLVPKYFPITLDLYHKEEITSACNQLQARKWQKYSWKITNYQPPRFRLCMRLHLFQTKDNAFPKRFFRVSETVKRETSTAENPSEICSVTDEGSSPDWLSEVFSQQWTPNLQNESTDVESSPYDTELKEVKNILLPQI